MSPPCSLRIEMRNTDTCEGVGDEDLRIILPDAHLPHQPRGKTFHLCNFPRRSGPGQLSSELKMRVPNAKLEKNCYLITPRRKTHWDLQWKRKRRQKGINNRATPELISWDCLTSLLETEQGPAFCHQTLAPAKENCLEEDFFLS